MNEFSGEVEDNVFVNPNKFKNVLVDLEDDENNELAIFTKGKRVWTP